jgi:cation diffusion facilitator family transporter
VAQAGFRRSVNPSRVQRSVSTSLLGLATNAVLACAKLTAGILGHSYALIADGIESSGDIVGSIVIWRGVAIGNRPADANHPYGYGRAETVAAAAVATMLMASALLIAVQSIREILTPHHMPAPYTLFVLLGVVFIKEGLFRFVGRVGAEVESTAVTADAWHHRSDAILSASVALGISIAVVGGEAYKSADNWAAIFAAGIIAWNGLRLLRPAVHELMDAAPQSDIANQAAAVARGVEGVRGVEKCLARKMGYDYILDMHVEVDGTLQVTAAHELAHVVKDAIQLRLPRIKEITIHIEPFPNPAKAKRERHAVS